MGEAMLRMLRRALPLAVTAAALAAPAADAAVQAGWVTKAPLPSGRYYIGAATGGDGRIYVPGGYDTSQGCEVASTYGYAPGSNSWSTVASMTQPRYLHAVAASGGRVYAIGGYAGNCYGSSYLNSVEAYSPSTNSWTWLTPMPTARYHLAAATAPDGRVVAIGGYNGTYPYYQNRVELYTPSSNSWTTGTSMPTARYQLTATTASDGKIYAIGGYNSNVGALGTVEVYNPATNSWSSRTSMPTPRYGHSAVLGADGRIYVFGGWGNSGLEGKTVEIYDPADDSWTTGWSLNADHGGGLAGTRAGDSVYAIGGSGSATAVEMLAEQEVPKGTVNIAGGADTTATATVTVGTAATDNLGVTRMRLSNSPSVTGGLLDLADEFAYRSSVGWDLTDPTTGGTSDTGTKTVYVQWRDAAGNWSDVASDSITYSNAPPPDTTGPAAFSLSAPTGNGYTTSTTPTMTWTASSDSGSGLAGYELWIDGVKRSTLASSVTSTAAPALSQGTHQWTVVAFDNAGNRTSTGASTFTVDSVAPTMTVAPAQHFNIPAGLGTTTVPVAHDWGGTDATAGICSYQVAESVNGGAFTTVYNGLATTLTRNTTPGSTYQYAVAARDCAGNVSAQSFGPAFRPQLVQENATTITTTGTWTRAPLTGASGGSVRYASAANASATVRFTGRNVAWVAPLSTTRGSAKVYVDGALRQTVSLYSTTAKQRQIVFKAGWPTSGSHTLKVVVVGTAGHPRVDVDAFVVLG